MNNSMRGGGERGLCQKGVRLDRIEKKHGLFQGDIANRGGRLIKGRGEGGREGNGYLSFLWWLHKLEGKKTGLQGGGAGEGSLEGNTIGKNGFREDA